MAFYQPWSVNSLAQAVIRDIFDHPEAIPTFYSQTRAYIREEKQVFLEHLAGLDNLHCYPSETYFVLARLEEGLKSEAFCDQVGQQKILIRDCANFKGLSNAFVRFSLKDRSCNLALAGLVKEILTHA